MSATIFNICAILSLFFVVIHAAPQLSDSAGCVSSNGATPDPACSPTPTFTPTPTLIRTPETIPGPCISLLSDLKQFTRTYSPDPNLVPCPSTWDTLFGIGLPCRCVFASGDASYYSHKTLDNIGPTSSPLLSNQTTTLDNLGPTSGPLPSFQKTLDNLAPRPLPTVIPISTPPSLY